jgi:hypothetical protein
VKRFFYYTSASRKIEFSNSNSEYCFELIYVLVYLHFEISALDYRTSNFAKSYEHVRCNDLANHRTSSWRGILNLIHRYSYHCSHITTKFVPRVTSPFVKSCKTNDNLRNSWPSPFFLSFFYHALHSPTKIRWLRNRQNVLFLPVKVRLYFLFIIVYK